MEGWTFTDKDMPRIMETCAAFGLLVRTGPCEYKHFPISLTPAKYPRSAYETAMQTMKVMSKLYDRVARRPEWMYE
jgi:hypothetical protein